MQYKLDKRTSKDRYDSTKLSKDMEFIGTLMQKEEADNKDIVSSSISAASNDTTK